jgi:hypothetical protein
MDVENQSRKTWYTVDVSGRANPCLMHDEDISHPFTHRARVFSPVSVFVSGQRGSLTRCLGGNMLFETFVEASLVRARLVYVSVSPSDRDEDRRAGHSAPWAETALQHDRSSSF